MAKISTGIRIDEDIINEIDLLVDSEEFVDLNPTRSEVINAVLWSLFVERDVPQDRFYQEIRKEIIRSRNRERKRKMLIRK